MSEKKRPASKEPVSQGVSSKDKGAAKKPVALKEAGATQKITKDELEALLKATEAESGKVPVKKPAPR